MNSLCRVRPLALVLLALIASSCTESTPPPAPVDTTAPVEKASETKQAPVSDSAA